MQIIILALIFLAVTGLAWWAGRWLNRHEAIKQRLHQLDKQDESPSSNGISQWWAKVLSPMAKLSTPKEGWDASSLRLRFMRAGLRDANWPVIFFAIKTVLALLLPGLFAVYQSITSVPLMLDTSLLIYILLAATGYYLPNKLLSSVTKSRQSELTNALPDALDLMTVCVEAGQGLDAAMNRAAHEISLRSAALADELNLLALELRMGVKRELALRNLALRCGVSDMSQFVAVLVQSDRFGTNVADALRVQAQTTRTHRRLRAEETAAKIPLKLLLPLIFFIFPSLMLVLMGPAMISIYRTLLPSVGGSN